MATKLLPFPFHDGGVNENAAIRVIRMVKPECPADPRPTIVLRNGNEVPNPRYTGEQNCQQVYRINNQGRWDVAKCVELGHDPYFTSFRTTVVEDVVDEQGYVSEHRERVKVEKRLNVIQVSDNIRHSSGNEVALAMARGCRPLEEFGYESPCEYRNCTQPVKIVCQYGRYCGERHARLVAADKREMTLVVGGDPYTEERALREREEQLSNIPLTVEAVK